MSMLTTRGLSTSEIEELLKPISQFVGVYPCDAIPNFSSRPCALIVNTDTANEPGEHWIAIILKEKGKALYFDSFGFPPLISSMQKYINENAPNGFKYNCITLQHPNSKTCGLYCAAFVALWSRKWTLRMFTNFFSGRFGRDLAANDNYLMSLFQNV